MNYYEFIVEAKSVANPIVDVKEQDIVPRASGYENQLLDTSNGKN